MISSDILENLPMLDCGACGFKTCEEFAITLPEVPEEIKRCIHLNGKKNGTNGSGSVKVEKPQGMAEKMGWIDNLQRPFDFILDCFDNEPGPRETILPYNPALVKELGVKKGDIMIGRPMGMSCGCPITHCGIVTRYRSKKWGYQLVCHRPPEASQVKVSLISVIIWPRGMKD